jgi:outer membrane lipoprotein SlyB
MTDVLVAVIALIGTVTGSISGIMISSKLSNYRIEQLEIKLDKYISNQDAIKERLIVVEQTINSMQDKLEDMDLQLNQLISGVK